MVRTITILPETSGSTLCLHLTGVVDAASFKEFFDKPLNDLLAKYGHYNLLVDYDAGFIRWEEEAADLSFKSIATCGPKARRCAYVNPPESRIVLMKIMNPMLTGEVRYFNADQKAEALAWVLEGNQT